MAAFIATLVIGLIHGAPIFAAWRAAHRLAGRPPFPVPPASWPPVRIVLPFAGAIPEYRPALDDLAAQDYPDFKLFLACHAEDEAACALAEAWAHEQTCRGGPSTRCVRAETARSCGQKNQNVLAALASPPPPDEILVFTDIHYRRPPDWLRALVAPIASKRAAAASGYYFAAPGEGWRSSLRPVTALLLFLTRQYGALRQPWGGATAIPRRIFDELRVADLWSTNVVDDVSLAQRLREARIPVEGVNAPALLAPAASPGDFSWGDWFARQLAYLRAIQPGVWAGLGAGFLLLAASLLWMAGRLARAGTDPASAAVAVFDLLLLAALALRLRRLHPQPGPRGNWLAAFFGFVLAAPACHLRTAFSRTIRWRGVDYRVGRGGRVLATSAIPANPPATTPAEAPPPRGAA